MLTHDHWNRHTYTHQLRSSTVDVIQLKPRCCFLTNPLERVITRIVRVMGAPATARLNMNIVDSQHLMDFICSQLTQLHSIDMSAEELCPTCRALVVERCRLIGYRHRHGRPQPYYYSTTEYITGILKMFAKEVCPMYKTPICPRCGDCSSEQIETLETKINLGRAIDTLEEQVPNHPAVTTLRPTDLQRLHGKAEECIRKDNRQLAPHIHQFLTSLFLKKKFVLNAKLWWCPDVPEANMQTSSMSN